MDVFYSPHYGFGINEARRGEDIYIHRIEHVGAMSAEKPEHLRGEAIEQAKTQAIAAVLKGQGKQLACCGMQVCCSPQRQQEADKGEKQDCRHGRWHNRDYVADNRIMPGHFFRQMKNLVPRQAHKYSAARHGHAHGEQQASVHGKADGPGACFFRRNNDKKAGENHQRTQHGADGWGGGICQVGPHGAGSAQRTGQRQGGYTEGTRYKCIARAHSHGAKEGVNDFLRIFKG